MLICHLYATLLEFIRPETRMFYFNTAIFKIRQLIFNDSESLLTLFPDCLSPFADLSILYSIFGLDAIWDRSFEREWEGRRGASCELKASAVEC